MTFSKGELFTRMTRMSTDMLEMFLEKQLNCRSETELSNFN